MTEEEKKAKAYAENKWQTDVMREASFDGYLAGLHEGQEENNKLLDVINNQDVKIADLEKKIEKMKCCENCKYNSYWGNELHCNYGLKEALQEDKLVECHNLDKWKLKESEE